MRTLLIAGLLLLFLDDSCRAQTPKKHIAQAPPNHSVISNAWGGAYFVPNELQEKFHKLERRLKSLQFAADRDGFDSRAVLAELDQVSQELAEVRARVEKEQVYVPILPTFEQVDTYNFDLADVNRLVILADKIHLEGWDGPGIRCILKKQILAESQPPPTEFEKLVVDHEIRIPYQFVGETTEEHQTRLAAFLKTPQGEKYAAELKAQGRSLMASDYVPDPRYTHFQGHQAHVIQLKGLERDGIKYIQYGIESAGIMRLSGSDVDRRLELTIQLPRQISALIHGCSGGVTVTNIEGDLTLTNNGSALTSRTYAVDGLRGNLACYGVPLQSVSRVNGSVLIDMNTEEWPAGGASSINDFRRYGADLSVTTSIRQITGDLTTKYVYTRLKVAEVDGVLNIVNEFGPTQLQLSNRIDLKANHRVVSESGAIHVLAPKSLLTDVDWFLCTTFGELRANVEHEQLQDLFFRSGDRGWIGLYSPPKDERASAGNFTGYDRPQAIMKNAERSLGVDVLTRAGRIVLEVQESATP